MTLEEVARATGGHVADVTDPTTLITGAVTFDSRQAGPGDLFLALPGEHVDGHEYAAAALSAGAVAVLADRPVGAPAIVVDDVLAALSLLAREVLGRLPQVTVVGITGSSGKTSTKDLVAQLLGRLGTTVAPPGSYNNELGHPYTVLLAGTDTRYLVLEYSARGIGHIAALCRVARPDIAVVLNVGTAHIGEFGSAEVIARAKAELVQPLDADSVAVLNIDDPRVAAMAASTQARVVFTGSSDSADVRAEDVRLDAHGRPSYTLVTAGGRAKVQLPLYGRHHVANSLSAAAVAIELGMPVADVAGALATVGTPSRWRMEVSERPDGVTVINDAYNANPDSMRAALEALLAIGRGRRTWAVLGQMAELGDRARAEHEALGRLVNDLGIDRLVAVGDEASHVHAGAELEGSRRMESVNVPDIEGALQVLREEVGPGDVVLVKASRAVGLERVALALLADEPVEGHA
ncbi:MAG: UDP-N-acetylmuramoyl-tripeptide--D-alanyl-D-alanine ligase [Mycobacteriales bacterium]